MARCLHPISPVAARQQTKSSMDAWNPPRVADVRGRAASRWELVTSGSMTAWLLPFREWCRAAPGWGSLAGCAASSASSTGSPSLGGAPKTTSLSVVPADVAAAPPGAPTAAGEKTGCSWVRTGAASERRKRKGGSGACRTGRTLLVTADGRVEQGDAASAVSAGDRVAETAASAAAARAVARTPACGPRTEAGVAGGRHGTIAAATAATVVLFGEVGTASLAVLASNVAAVEGRDIGGTAAKESPVAVPEGEAGAAAKLAVGVGGKGVVGGCRRGWIRESSVWGRGDGIVRALGRRTAITEAARRRGGEGDGVDERKRLRRRSWMDIGGG